MAKKSLRKLSVSELHAEIQRRQRRLPALRKKYRKLKSQLGAIEKQLAELGDSVPAGKAAKPKTVRKRPKNKASLAVSLAKVMSKTKPITIEDVAEKVKQAGYKTTSKSFKVIVNQTLVKDKRFKSSGRGKYLLA